MKGIYFWCLVFVSLIAGCSFDSREDVFVAFDSSSKYRMVAFLEKSRKGLEGWDLLARIENIAGKELARVTISSLDLKEDYKLSEFKVINMQIAGESPVLLVKFANDKEARIPIIWHSP